MLSAYDFIMHDMVKFYKRFTNLKIKEETKVKNLLSKILIMTMLISVIYVPTSAFASNDFSLTITEDAFGIKEEIDINIKNKVKGSKYTWITSNEKIATVDKVGVVRGLKAGDVIITCIITTADGETHEFTSDITINSKTKVTVVNQKQLEEALANEEVEQIIIKTSKEKEFVIPEGKYDKRLYMKAPEAEIINEGKFKSVHIYVSNQEQLDKALANDKITIITIVTDEEEDFELVGDHSRIRVIINAPAATVLNNAILRGVDIKEVNTLEEKVYVPEEKEDEAEVTPIPEEEVEEELPPVIIGGGGYVPSVPSNPVVTNPTPTPTEAQLLATAKANAINSINEKVKAHDVSKYTDSQKIEFNTMKDAEIEKINNVGISTAVSGVLNSALSTIDSFKPSNPPSGDSDALKQAKADMLIYVNRNKNYMTYYAWLNYRNGVVEEDLSSLERFEEENNLSDSNIQAFVSKHDLYEGLSETEYYTNIILPDGYTAEGTGDIGGGNPIYSSASYDIAGVTNKQENGGRYTFEYDGRKYDVDSSGTYINSVVVENADVIAVSGSALTINITAWNNVVSPDKLVIYNFNYHDLGDDEYEYYEQLIYEDGREDQGYTITDSQIEFSKEIIDDMFNLGAGKYGFVVKSNVEYLGFDNSLDTEQGAGTIIHITVQ